MIWNLILIKEYFGEEVLQLCIVGLFAKLNAENFCGKLFQTERVLYAKSLFI